MLAFFHAINFAQIRKELSARVNNSSYKTALLLTSTYKMLFEIKRWRFVNARHRNGSENSIQFHIALEIVTVIFKKCDQEISTGL